MIDVIRRHLTPERRAFAAQFLRFGVVGVFGLGVDTATVYAVKGTLGLYGAGVVSYFVAATATWLVNRAWTFRGHGEGSLLRQWALYLFANLGGLTLNRGSFFLLITISPLCAAIPAIPLAVGAVAGMFANFHLSRVVFAVRRHAGNA